MNTAAALFPFPPVMVSIIPLLTFLTVQECSKHTLIWVICDKTTRKTPTSSLSLISQVLWILISFSCRWYLTASLQIRNWNAERMTHRLWLLLVLQHVTHCSPPHSLIIIIYISLETIVSQTLASDLADVLFTLVCHVAIVLVAGKIMAKGQRYTKFWDSKHLWLQTDVLNRQPAKTTPLLFCNDFCQSSWGACSFEIFRNNNNN